MSCADTADSEESKQTAPAILNDLFGTKECKPSWSMHECKALLAQTFDNLDEDLKLSPLPSYEDQNFLVESSDSHGKSYVLKIANTSHGAQSLAMEVSYAKDLANAGFPVPVPLSPKKGSEIWNASDVHASPSLSLADLSFLREHGLLIATASSGVCHLVRLVPYMPGILLRDVPRTPNLLRGFGAFLGRMDKISISRSPQTSCPSRQSIAWNLDNAPAVMSTGMQHFETLVQQPVAQDEKAPSTSASHTDIQSHRLSLLKQGVALYSRRVGPLYSKLRRCVLHNDANNENVLLDSENQFVGLIDFGDACETAVISNLCIAAVYCMVGAADPWQVVTTILKGYHSQNPLSAAEISVMPTLLLARMCVSVCMSAAAALKDPTNAHTQIDLKDRWDLIELLCSESHDDLAAKFAQSIEVDLG